MELYISYRIQREPSQSLFLFSLEKKEMTCLWNTRRQRADIKARKTSRSVSFNFGLDAGLKLDSSCRQRIGDKKMNVLLLLFKVSIKKGKKTLSICKLTVVSPPQMVSFASLAFFFKYGFGSFCSFQQPARGLFEDHFLAATRHLEVLHARQLTSSFFSLPISWLRGERLAGKGHGSGPQPHPGETLRRKSVVVCGHEVQERSILGGLINY